MVIPLGDRDSQILTLIERDPVAGTRRTTLGDVRFVPLLGKHGFQ
jgi:protein-L-isoaspartate O-methyltransferase